MKNNTLDYQIFEHKNSLQAFAMRFTQNTDDADDLVQDTMLKAIRYASKYTEGTNLKAWLFIILKNTFINDYRRLVKQKSLITTQEDLSSDLLFKSSTSNRADDKFMGDDINKAFQQLEPAYSVPFLKYFEGYKYHEISEMLEIPIGTVKTRIHVARHLLKSNLKMYNQEYKKTNKFN